MPIKTIYIDVGHGKTNEDSGASAYSAPTKYYENERNRRIATACKERLIENGYAVIMSRNGNDSILTKNGADVNVNTGNIVGKYNRADSNLINSANACKAAKCDFMISIHCNDSSNTSARGYWLCHKGDNESIKIATAIANGFDKHYTGKLIPRNSISTNYTAYGILRLHDKPGCLVECGFMSNALDLHEILCNYKEIGYAIAEGIAGAYGKKAAEDTTDWKTEYVQLEKKYNSLKTERDNLKAKYDKLLATRFDVNEDGTVDADDVIALLKKILK